MVWIPPKRMVGKQPDPRSFVSPCETQMPDLAEKRAGLPEGPWTAAWSTKHQRWFWEDRGRCLSTWEKPAECNDPPSEGPPEMPDLAAKRSGLPEGWECEWDIRHQRVYYFNRKTKERTWKCPVAPVAVKEVVEAALWQQSLSLQDRKAAAHLLEVMFHELEILSAEDASRKDKHTALIEMLKAVNHLADLRWPKTRGMWFLPAELEASTVSSTCGGKLSFEASQRFPYESPSVEDLEDWVEQKLKRRKVG